VSSCPHRFPWLQRRQLGRAALVLVLVALALALALALQLQLQLQLLVLLHPRCLLR
jgi:hypothetical protein